jgi:hypothetical protein
MIFMVQITIEILKKTSQIQISQPKLVFLINQYSKPYYNEIPSNKQCSFYKKPRKIHGSNEAK